MSRLDDLRAAGVSIWLDTLSRELLDSGRFRHLIDHHAVTGATSNPAIFARAFQDPDRYRGQLRSLVQTYGLTDAGELFLSLALEDVTRAAQALRAVHERSAGSDGFVSFECTPDVADDTEATVAQALALAGGLDEPNVLIKVPGTEAGVPAVEELVAQGVNVNVTLLFAVSRYDQIIDAYMRGLERRVASGLAVDRITSVASFFVSRVDNKAHAALAPHSRLRGKVAIANAQVAYGRCLSRFSGERWERLARAGARPQRPLWASTQTKDPALSDVLYVESLIAPDVINTMPEATLQAFGDHGTVHQLLGPDSAAAHAVLDEAAHEGFDLDRATAELEREGVAAFGEAYGQTLEAIEEQVAPLRKNRGPRDTNRARVFSQGGSR